MLLQPAAMLFCLSTVANAGFVVTVEDPNGTWWFERDGERFMSFVINHVNDGGQGAIIFVF